jgi:4-hydroxythreonine-4-phosphate dehydrogenase
MTVPRLGVTLGDPGGIGPEIVLAAFSGRFCLPEAQYIIFGSSAILDEEGRARGTRLDLTPWDGNSSPGTSGLFLRDIKTGIKNVHRGSSFAENGEASFLFFKEAVEAARRGDVQGLITAPISKKSWNLAGMNWRGHTEYLAQFYPEAVMAFWSEKIKVALLSHHLPLREALRGITKERLLEYFLLMHRILERSHPGQFEFLVAGLNPHAGEDGLLGSEETTEITPAIQEAKKRGVRVSGPYPPDTVFLQALKKPGQFVLSLFHDQGLIAFKLVAFDTGVNITLGMPFVRTSPDHGTAFDIAGKGMASPQSMVEAIRLAFAFLV